MKKVFSVLFMAVAAFVLVGCEKDPDTKQDTYGVRYTFSLKNCSDEFNDMVAGIAVYANGTLKGTVTDNHDFTETIAFNAKDSVIITTQVQYNNGYVHNPEKTLKAQFNHTIEALTNGNRSDWKSDERTKSYIGSEESTKTEISKDFKFKYKVVVADSTKKAVLAPTL